LALAWATFHLTSGGIWLQQLVNFMVTALAWAVACISSRNPLTFAWISFVCGAVYFSGYIYLFHLHGVFYPPLFLFISALLLHQSRAPSLSWRVASTGFAVAAVVGMFHTFALLIFVAYISGLWVECLLDHRTARLGAALLNIGATVLVAKLLLGNFSVELAEGNNANKSGDLIRGLLTSYQMLENNRLIMMASVLLAVFAGIAIGVEWRERLVGALVAGVGTLALALAGLPAIIGWILICLIGALRRRRIALGALIVTCAILPVATGTGSPTYAIFVLMPCILATADGLPALPGPEILQRRCAATVATMALALSIALRAGMALPLVSGLVLPLRAEQEKTVQFTRAIEWLDDHPEVAGDLELCDPGGYPTRTVNAVNRTHRAPTESTYLRQYVKARFGPRLASGPTLYLCFGGQRISYASVLYSIPGRWAGTASIQSRVGAS
jgi:hypothetical protein